jgi:aryl-alcohol dehydrogenase-like predicted oxidoreductase
MWRFRGTDVAAARALVEAAFDAGVTLFDTADIYGPDNDEDFGAAEALLGRVFAEAPALRDKMVLASKGGIRMGVPYDSSATYLAEAIDASLTRLGCDKIDLYQIHRPDLLAHPQEVARARWTMRARRARSPRSACPTIRRRRPRRWPSSFPCRSSATSRSFPR